MVATPAIFCAILLGSHPTSNRAWKQLLCSALIIIFLIVQNGVINAQGVLAIKDGQECYSCAHLYTTDVYLATHYDGKLLLDDTYSQNVLDENGIGIDLKNVIYTGTYQIFPKALQSPGDIVDWILIAPSDTSFPHVHLNSLSFNATFVPVAYDPSGLVLYHKINQPIITHSPSPFMYSDAHKYCGLK
jgi:hypothetical protein